MRHFFYIKKLRKILQNFHFCVHIIKYSFLRAVNFNAQRNTIMVLNI